MQTLSKGFRKPQTGDFGTVFFPALEQNFQQLNDHIHNGIDSEKLSAINLSGYPVTILGASFIYQGDGYWRQTITVPGGLSVDNFVLTFRDPTTKEHINLRTQKLSSTTYYVYTNFVQNFEVLYGV